MFENYFFRNVKNRVNYDEKTNIKRLIAFRGSVVIFMSVLLSYNFITSVTYTNMFVYMTIWGAISSYLYFCLSLVENVSYYLNDKKQYFQDSLWQAATILYVIAFCFELPIVAMYWLYLYPQGVLDNASAIHWINEISIHGIFCLCILVDFYFNAIPFQSKFLFIQMTAAFIYGITNCIYVKTQNVEIYTGISWDNLITAIIIPSAAIAMIFTFCLGKCLYITLKEKKPSSFPLLLDEQGQSLQNEKQQQ